MRTVSTLLVVLACTLIASGQERFDDRIVVVDPGISSGRLSLLLPQSRERESVFGILSFSSVSQVLRSRSPFVGGDLEDKAGLRVPLRLHMEKRARLQLLERESAFRFPPYSSVSQDLRVRSPFVGGVLEDKVDLTLPLRLHMEKQARLQPFQAILRTMQKAGAAYIAYRHINKYGLLK